MFDVSYSFRNRMHLIKVISEILSLLNTYKLERPQKDEELGGSVARESSVPVPNIQPQQQQQQRTSVLSVSYLFFLFALASKSKKKSEKNFDKFFFIFLKQQTKLTNGGNN